MVREKHPNMDNRNITRILGEWWANLNLEEKAKYVDLAKQVGNDFNSCMAIHAVHFHDVFINQELLCKCICDVLLKI